MTGSYLILVLLPLGRFLDLLILLGTILGFLVLLALSTKRNPELKKSKKSGRECKIHGSDI
jgi:hypothetical protein